MIAKPKVFVSRVIPDTGLKLLRAHCDVDVWAHDRAPSRAELIAACKDKDALVCLLTEKVDGSVLAELPSVTIVAIAAVAARNVIAFFAGEAPTTALNPEVLGRTAMA